VSFPLGLTALFAMKRTAVFFLSVAFVSSVAFAVLQPWNLKRRPPIPLPAAYAIAAQALGAATNEFYCVNARTQVSRSSGGEWVFMFCSTNGGEKNVFVFLDGGTKPEVVHGGVDY
jgi:hypothetical protein